MARWTIHEFSPYQVNTNISFLCDVNIIAWERNKENENCKNHIFSVISAIMTLDILENRNYYNNTIYTSARDNISLFPKPIWTAYRQSFLIAVSEQKRPGVDQF